MTRVFHWAAGPTGLAVVLTLLNAAKPAVVDDAAYLLTAQHIAGHPLDPYGFELFWYYIPEPAMNVLLPPVVPYWLAAGVRLFGDHLFLLKLWLLPFALILAHALNALLRRFAPGVGGAVLPGLVLGPAVLPMFGVMLDVPAVALGTAAVALMVRGCDGRGFGWVIGSGLLAGLAAQTKYTMLALPAVLAWYGVSSGRRLAAAVAVVVAVGAFAAWEGVTSEKYGESHFRHHVREQSERAAARNPGATDRERAAEWVRVKARLFQPMLGNLGGLAVGAGMLAAAAIGTPRWLLAGTAGVTAVGVLAVVFYPTDAPGGGLPNSVFVTTGAAASASVLAALLGLFVRPGRMDRASVFLVGWLAIELASYYLLTPFPAARRVIGLALVGGLIAARAAAVGPNRIPRWVPRVGVAAGVGLFALDSWDALPEKVLAERAAAVAGPPGPHTVWFNGHWGFQYYCERAGMRQVVPRYAWNRVGPSVLSAGDYLVFPEVPDDQGFYRPYHGGARFRPDPTAVELVEMLSWADPVPGVTVPTLYGGTVPVSRRPAGQPRLRVAVYRVTRDWTPDNE